MARGRRRSVFIALGLSCLILLNLPFALWSLSAGMALINSPDLSGNRFYHPNASVTNFAIFLHMGLGAMLMVFVPLQVWPGLRSRFAAYHRWAGRCLCAAAAATGLGGLIYIAVHGTIGGLWMSIGFALYGGLILLSACQVVRFARGRSFERHRRWALRLLVLTFGSWLYRVHYGVWYLITDGWASTPEFNGTFDFVQNFAFYLPYLLLLELWLRRSRPVTVSG